MEKVEGAGGSRADGPLMVPPDTSRSGSPARAPAGCHRSHWCLRGSKEGRRDAPSGIIDRIHQQEAQPEPEPRRGA